MKIESTHIKTTLSHALKNVNQRRHFLNNTETKGTHDQVIVEEPILISLTYLNKELKKQTLDLTIIMRTPGFDTELVIGFLFNEHIIHHLQDIVSIDVYDEVDAEVNTENHVEVILADHVEIDTKSITRNFPSQSSCGICGKSALNALALHTNMNIDDSADWLKKSDIIMYSQEIKSHQPLFESTGGVHGAGYIADGKWLCVFEDVGRHNAVDKVIGKVLLSNSFTSRSVLVLSGRVSFELIQKAITAGIAIVIAIGAPSSLAVSAAIQFNITLIGFTKNTQFNVYSGNHRIKGTD